MKILSVTIAIKNLLGYCSSVLNRARSFVYSTIQPIDALECRATHWFFRTIGCFYVLHFLIQIPQHDGLYAKNGVFPAFATLTESAGPATWSTILFFPSITWLSDSTTIHILAYCLGTVLGLALTFRFLDRWRTAILCGTWAIALLLLNTGGPAMIHFPWEGMLLELGAIAILCSYSFPCSSISIYLVNLLFFRMMFTMGVVKLFSSHPGWHDYTFTRSFLGIQAFLSPLGWWIFNAPEWLNKLSTIGILITEVVFSFFVFLPRTFFRLKIAFFIVDILLLVLIFLCTNHGYFPLISLVPGIFILIPPRRWAAPDQSVRTLKNVLPNCARQRTATVILFAVFYLFVTSLWLFESVVRPPNQIAFAKRDWFWSDTPKSGIPVWALKILRLASNYGVSSPYDVYSHVPNQSGSSRIEASIDGKTWKPYEKITMGNDEYKLANFVSPLYWRIDFFASYYAIITQPGSVYVPRSATGQEALVRSLVLPNSPAEKLFLATPYPSEIGKCARLIHFQQVRTSITEFEKTGKYWLELDPVERYRACSPLFILPHLETPLGPSRPNIENTRR